MRLSSAERGLLEVVADSTSIEGSLAFWRDLRKLLARLGAPCGAGLGGAVLRQIAGEVLVELGFRPRPDGPLVCMSLHAHLAVYRHGGRVPRCRRPTRPRRRSAA